jgi:hypothetical protein
MQSLVFFLIMEYNNFIKHIVVQNNIFLVFHKQKSSENGSLVETQHKYSRMTI